MNRSSCPECRAKLADYRYADACPHCQAVLAHNQADPMSVPKAWKAKPWPIRALLRVVRFIES